MDSGKNHIEGINLESLVTSTSRNVPSDGQLDSPSALLEDTSLTPELRNKVFENELIRDQIFDFAFSSNRSGKKLVNKDVLTCRLVDHAWLDYTTSRLQKSGSPEFTIDFVYSYKSREDQDRREKKHQVYKFLDTWIAYPGAGSRIPLFKMEINIFGSPIEFPVQSLVNCLTLCGNGLHNLTLRINHLVSDDDAKIEANCKKIITITGKINLPNLTELRVVLPEFKDNKRLVCLLLSRILSGCQRLTFLSFTRGYCGVSQWSRLFLEKRISSGQSQQLPNTLVKLEITIKIKTALLKKLLLDGSLPNLSWLKLGYMIGVDTDVLSRIIHRYSRQLNHFYLHGAYFRHRAKSSVNRVVFPVMTKLKDMCIFELYSEPQPGINLPFPMLETLKLQGQTPSMLQNWIQNSPYSCVKELTVDLCKNLLKADDIFTKDLSQLLHIAFPHVQKLETNFGLRCTSEDGSIQNIFQCMPQLCDLTLRPYISDQPTEVFTWDAILLGVTPEYAKTLAEYPREEWDTINLNHHRMPSRSILNLSRLTKFHLEDSIGIRSRARRISDLSFSFALLRMPNLETLTLDGAFGATPEMVLEWQRRGRKFYGHVQRDGDVSESEEEIDDADIYAEEGGF